MAKDCWQSTAESMMIFTMLLAPALLRGHFRSHQYYDHFLKLVQLIDMCMGLELPQSQIQIIGMGFADWVKDFEWYGHLQGFTQSMHTFELTALPPNNSLAKQIGSYLGTLYDTDAKEIEQHVKAQELDVWGKMQQTMEEERLDMINGYLFMPDMETPHHDATYVKYISQWDHSMQGRPKHIADGAIAFGCMEYFLILDDDLVLNLLGLNDDDIDVTEELFTETLTLTIISPIPSFKRLNDCNLVTYNLTGGKLAPQEVVNMWDLDCLVGHIRDLGGHWYIVDHMTVVGNLEFVNLVMDPDD
ncbi:hypothetical protein FRC11_002437 [Ceratobasidium sp. 423]|nr:hypothetical protein FRC11_002437 [Ceratobasidium sp. 423]